MPIIGMRPPPEPPREVITILKELHKEPKKVPLDLEDLPENIAKTEHQPTLKKETTQLDLLECISRKSGMPRWVIAIAIFASALVVLWLCFSLTAPPDDIKIVKTKVR